MTENFSTEDLNQKNTETQAAPESFNYKDVTEVMKEYNAYFVHTIQVDNRLNVSENNKAINTESLAVSDKLDILYAANLSISTSTIRPNTLDGTFRGGFGVVLSAGKIDTAHQSDIGSIAVSVSERVIHGAKKDTSEDIENAINRNYLTDKSYNEIVVGDAEVAGGFIKLDKSFDVSYEELEMDYGTAGGGVVSEKVGKLNLSNVYNKDKYGNLNPNDAKKRYDTTFNTLREMDIRGPVFVMSNDNELFLVKDIDAGSRVVTFSTTPFTPKDVAEIYGNHYLSKEGRQSAIERLLTKGVDMKK